MAHFCFGFGRDGVHRVGIVPCGRSRCGVGRWSGRRGLWALTNLPFARDASSVPHGPPVRVGPVVATGPWSAHSVRADPPGAGTVAWEWLVVRDGGTAEMNTIGSGDRSIGIPERSTRDIFDYQEEMRGRGRPVGMSDMELEQERMRASFTSVASGEGRARGDDGQQRASFGASRTLRWKLDH